MIMIMIIETPHHTTEVIVVVKLAWLEENEE
jgi:hypothetical protein